MTTIEKLKDLRSKFENSRMAVSIMDDLISDEYFNDDSFCKILFNSEAIDGRNILWDMDGMVNEFRKVETSLDPLEDDEEEKDPRTPSQITLCRLACAAIIEIYLGSVRSYLENVIKDTTWVEIYGIDRLADNGYYVDNEEIIAAIDDIIATIDEQ